MSVNNINTTLCIGKKEYIIEKTYDMSGQKKVYKVKDENEDNYIIKVLQFNEIGDTRRFWQEIEVLQSIDSPNFAKLYYKDIDLDKKEYRVIEEYIDGKTLREDITAYKGNELNCITLFKKLILGLQNLWEKNIVHRDLKPENIIIKTDGNPVILDLGIAKKLYSSNSITLTNERMPLSNNYCAPEQYKNEDFLISIRTDFFVLGIVLSEIYTGIHPFKATDGKIDILGEYNKTDSVKLNKFIKKLLAKEPFNRFRTEKLILDYIEREWNI